MIHLDFETFSELDVSKVGSFKYAEHPSTEVLIMCWAIDDGPVKTWSPWGKFTDQPYELFKRVGEGEQIGAHNAQFEFCVWNSVLSRQLKNVPLLRPRQLNCTAARAAMCSLPRSLERAGAALRCRIQKDKRGGSLIKTFCGPHKPTNKDPRTRILPTEAPELFEEFKQYCQTDVKSEREIDRRLPALPPFEQRSFRHDLMMNRRGIPVDIQMIKRAAKVVMDLERRTRRRVHSMTGGINPTQRDKLMRWLKKRGYEMDNLQASTVKSLLLTDQNIPPSVRKVLELRIEANKVSTKKLISMERVACEDRRARGTLLYYGAHTGRAAGRLIQPQNFIRGLPDMAEQVALMKTVFELLEMNADADIFEFVFDAPLTAIAQCMRGFIAAKEGKQIMVVDYAQIEARLLCWLSDEEEAVREYREYDAGKGHDRYVLMAAFLWNINPEQVTKDQRRIAKNLVLGCGFGLGWKKFIVYCANQDVHIEEEMSQRAVRAFREKHPSVCQFWRDVEQCALTAVRKQNERIFLRNISFFSDGKFLTIRLPSGRDLYYPEPMIKPSWPRKTCEACGTQVDMEHTGSCLKCGGEEKQIKLEKNWRPSMQLTFKDEKKRMWVRVGTYGGRLVENIVQGTARDIMNEGCFAAEKGKYPIVMIVHDELLCEIETEKGKLEELKRLACKIGPWIGDCPIAADGFVTNRYRKG